MSQYVVTKCAMCGNPEYEVWFDGAPPVFIDCDQAGCGAPRDVCGPEYTIYVCNAFSLSMLNREFQKGSPNGYTPRSGDPVESIGRARIPRPVDDPVEQLALWEEAADIVSAVGHLDTAALFFTVLGREIAPNRVSIKLGPRDFALVGQYVGPRLPEGTKTLPEGAAIQWWWV